MPYPSQVDTETIVRTASRLIEDNGVNNLSLNKLAQHLGVKAPSLYRYFANKAALLRAVNTDTTKRLFAALGAATGADSADAYTQLVQVADAYRAFALANPQVYGLVFTNTIDDLRPDEADNAQGALPYQVLIAEIAGEKQALTALRGFLALLHGFVMLEIASQLRRGGDLNAAYRRSVRAYLDGWQSDVK